MTSQGIRGWAIAIATVLLLPGCAMTGSVGCNIDEEAVKGCRQRLVAGTPQEGSREYSAIESLDLHFKQYQESKDCSRFLTVFEAHIAPLCR